MLVSRLERPSVWEMVATRPQFQFLMAVALQIVPLAGSSEEPLPTADKPVHEESTTEPRFTNHLAGEKSPYLLQHVHNPVDWYPWGEEAFAKAREENKPIFLSIGYSTCHWCHVMERETFESEKVGEFLNEHYVSIKVDREERPDIDKIYMAFVQATTGSGGWPMTVFLTPDLKPFFGGTYFPPEGKFGRPGFLELIEHINQLWTTRHDEVVNSANGITQNLMDHLGQESDAKTVLAPVSLEKATDLFKREYDPVNGGFGGAPKFPRPSQPSFLLAHGVRSGDTEAVDMVLETCRKMAAGGIYDHLGGGFARYSVDSQWLVPHFEKMLYDNAQLMNLYIDAYLVSKEANFLDVARDILRYVERDMTHELGGFFSAEDADSEGKEGKFYCWTRTELEPLLTPEEFNVAATYYGITEEGNFLDHSDPDPLKNQNVLSIVSPDLSSEDKALLESATSKMFAARSKRVRPHLDDKVLTSWNGLMLGAVARLHAVTGDLKIGQIAQRNLSFIKGQMWDESTSTLHHRWREGERDDVQLLVAYAYLLDGTLELYQATLNAEHLEFAVRLADSMIERFYDADKGGFWQCVTDGTQIVRVKDDYDGAEPSGNSVAILALFKLATITDREEYRSAAEKTLQLFADRIQSIPQAVPHMLLALEHQFAAARHVVITGDPQENATKELIRSVHEIYNPAKVVLGVAGPVEQLANEFPRPKRGPEAYVCTATECKPPTRDPRKLAELLAP